MFVGEALVGNEAVDQLTRFNRAFKDFSQSSSPRQIDGMILTKFDTIDDKVMMSIHSLLGWSRLVHDLFNWETHLFCRNGTNIY